MSRFISDCSRCCGLCCIVPGYLKIQGFAHDKPAHLPCRHLDHNGRCDIHGERALHGFAACGGFQCDGAGPWITQVLFQGASWRDSPATARAMAAAWHHWLPRFQAAALLHAAVPLAGADAAATLQSRIDALLDAGSPRCVAHTDSLALQRDTIALIRSLLDQTSPATRR